MQKAPGDPEAFRRYCARYYCFAGIKGISSASCSSMICDRRRSICTQRAVVVAGNTFIIYFACESRMEMASVSSFIDCAIKDFALSSSMVSYLAA